MSYILAYITLAVLVLNIVIYWKTYHYKSLLHPGLVFSILWVASVISWLITTSIKSSFHVIYPQYVNELNGYILFTSLFFLILVKFGRNKVLEFNPEWSVRDFQYYFNILAIISFLSAISYFFSAGATFDVANNRARLLKYGFENGFELKSLFEKTQSILMSFYFPCSIYAGYVLGLNADQTNSNNTLSKINKFVLFLPAVSIILNAIAKGARAPIVEGALYYIFGLGIAFSQITIQNNRYIKKVRNFIILVFIVFNLYSTFVNITRSRILNNIENLTWDGYPMLKPFAGVLEYLSCHYMGYQYRHLDVVTEDKLELGVTTFNGVLFFSVPFSSILGFNISLGQQLKLKQFNTYDYINYNTPAPKWHYTTFTSFLFLYDDFGYIGTFVVLAILVILSHYLFVFWLSTNHKYFAGIFLLFAFWYFWANSIFPSYFSTNLSTPFFLLLFIDILRGIRPRQKYVAFSEV
jgi:oligosaccharide repeat unit polymerase